MTVTALDRALVAGDAGRVTGEQERPDPEVSEKARGRTFTAQYKLAQDPAQVGLVPDEGSVQELAPASADPVFGDRVHPGCPDVAQHGPDSGTGEDRVERSCAG